MPKSPIQKKKEYKPKLCKVCKKKFQPVFGLQRVCCYQCGIQDHRITKQKADEKRLRKDNKDARERLKTRSDHAKDTQKECNAYIRLRDKNDGCISCDKPASWGGQWHASHYRPSGNCSSLRFHPLNIHKACSECNNFKSGNLSEYRISLINKIGLKNVEWLEAQNRTYKWDTVDLKEIKRHYKSLIKMAKKDG